MPSLHFISASGSAGPAGLMTARHSSELLLAGIVDESLLWPFSLNYLPSAGWRLLASPCF